MTVMMMTDTSPLGPLQDFWEAWEDAHDVLRRKPVEHFRKAFVVQVEELTGHIRAGKEDKAANEAADMVSVGLNLMRMLGYTPEQAANLMRDRANERMRGKTEEILQKYP